ncbi:MAG: histone deacetylase family protein [Candidatus Methylacidiphilales bacterium]
MVTDLSCLGYEKRGHPEQPARVERTVRHLRALNLSALRWTSPQVDPEAAIMRAHTAYHLAHLEEGMDFDQDTPSYEAIAQHARKAVSAALTGLNHVMEGDQAFVLMRPPGHHATGDRAMGFCYLNQVAVAALEARSRGVERVAVFDFDVHHGNGTESILRGIEGTLFVSVHQHPCYPGTGLKSEGNILNYPVLPLTPPEEYLEVIGEALGKISAWKPQLVVVSAGFDAYRGDTISDQLLECEDFEKTGLALASLNVPLLHVLEGGYSENLPELIEFYLRGVDVDCVLAEE